ncbi:MAG: hypothetical protein H6737_30750 [Alphaproteobacteria bacterium]|nr:hypothetical protein [Alphaproteobacteria bacterium]
MIRRLGSLALLLAFVPTTAFAQDEGIPVTVEVRDEVGEIISTAVVRHPNEKEQHKVNTETGRWTEKVLYMMDGSEYIFAKGEILTFEVSAPGFKNATVTYVVRKRKNLIPVQLEKLDLDLTEDQDMSPNINFGRDKPLDK